MLDTAAVRKIAKLARIAITPQETEHFARELSGILAFVEQLNAVDTSGIAALTSVSNLALPWRKDVVTDGEQASDVLKNAPMQEHGCFGVPKVIE